MKRLLIFSACVLGLACTPRDQDQSDDADTATPQSEQYSPPGESSGEGSMGTYEDESTGTYSQPDTGTTDSGADTGGMMDDSQMTTELPPFQSLDVNSDGVIDENEINSVDPELRAELQGITRDEQGRITQEEYERFRMAH